MRSFPAALASSAIGQSRSSSASRSSTFNASRVPWARCSTFCSGMTAGIGRAATGGTFCWRSAISLDALGGHRALDSGTSKETGQQRQELVASHAPGDAPDAPAVEQPRSRVLRFEVAADTFATFREAMHRLQRVAGGSLDDDALLLVMARHVLGGPRDEGRSSYQVALSICSACGCGAQRAGSELVPIDRAIVAMAACDAQHLADLLPRVAELRAANENASAHAAAGGQRGTPEPPAVSSGDENPRARQCSDHAHMGASSQRGCSRRRGSDELEFPTRHGWPDVVRGGQWQAD
jgi:hypothetical protein